MWLPSGKLGVEGGQGLKFSFSLIMKNKIISS